MRCHSYVLRTFPCLRYIQWQRGFALRRPPLPLAWSLRTLCLFTGVRLGSGADATVFEVDWSGTRCAAKRLHEILLEDQLAGGVAKLLSNVEAECLTWSKLRHPGVVQFLGVHANRRSLLPVLVMEKMDTSLIFARTWRITARRSSLSIRKPPSFSDRLPSHPTNKDGRTTDSCFGLIGRS